MSRLNLRCGDRSIEDSKIAGSSPAHRNFNLREVKFNLNIGLWVTICNPSQIINSKLVYSSLFPSEEYWTTIPDYMQYKDFSGKIIHINRRKKLEDIVVLDPYIKKGFYIPIFVSGIKPYIGG